MQSIIKKLESQKKLDDIASKYTLLIDENHSENGALFFISMDKFEAKILVPAPYHSSLLLNGPPTYRKLLNHKEAMMLR